jgi:hypothetical protein
MTLKYRGIPYIVNSSFVWFDQKFDHNARSDMYRAISSAVVLTYRGAHYRHIQ